MKVELRISRATDEQHSTCAWYLPTADAASWLHEILAWNTVDETLRLAIIPCAVENPTPRGLLVVPPPNIEVHASSWVIPYGQVGNRFYLPVDAKLCPRLDGSELDDQFPSSQDSYVFHPATGFVCVQRWLHVEDLLQVDAVSTTRWDRAKTGTHFASVLKSIEAVYPATLETVDELLQQGADDIAEVDSDDESNWEAQLQDTLASDRRAGRTWRIREWIRGRISNRTLFGAIIVLTMLVGIAFPILLPLLLVIATIVFVVLLISSYFRNRPQRPRRRQRFGARRRSSPSNQPGSNRESDAGRRPTSAPAAQLGAFLTQALAGPLSWLAGSGTGIKSRAVPRQKDPIAKLLDLLERDPERGLRFSIPLTKGGNWNMNAPPQPPYLTGHDLHFQASSGSSWGSSVFIRGEHWRALRKRYEALARRELQLGRHRRAAYIYGNLLDDYRSAVQSLEQGQHWREAAIVHRDKLKNGDDAARCFEAGNQWSDAIELWTQLEEFEKLGDLYTRIQEHDKAEAAYRRQLGALVESHRIQAAVKLLEHKLDRPLEAIKLVDESWHDALQPTACLQQGFRLRSELGLHAETIAWIESLKQQDATHPHVQGLEAAKESLQQELAAAAVSALQTMPQCYADPQVCRASSDAIRVISSRYANRAPADIAAQLINSVRSTSPNDAFLSRDCSRFITEVRNTRQKLGSQAPIRVVGEAAIGGMWECVVGIGPYYLVLGYDTDFRPSFGMGLSGTTRFARESVSSPSLNVELATLVPLTTTQAMAWGDGPLALPKEIRIPKTGSLPGCLLKRPVWLPDTASGLATHPNGTTAYVATTQDGLELRFRTDDSSIGFDTNPEVNALIQELAVATQDNLSPTIRPMRLDSDHRLWLAIGHWLLLVDLENNDGSMWHPVRSSETCDFIRAIRLHCAAPDETETLANVVIETCYDYALHRTANGRLIQISDDNIPTVTTGNTRGGATVAVDESSIRVWQDLNRAPVRLPHPNSTTTDNLEAVLASEYRDRFVLFYRDGRMVEYEHSWQ